MSPKNKPRRRGAARERERPQGGSRLAALPWDSWLIPLPIAVLTFAVFAPAVHGQFVWDDTLNLSGNSLYRGLGWPQLRWMFTTFHMGHYIPLTWMTFGLDYLVWGTDPFGYHLTNVVLHAANAVIVYFIARRLLGAALPGGRMARALTAGAVALLFALHPLRAESVAWATERRDVLSGLFYLLAVLAYLRACERGARWRRWYWATVALFWCALFSKSMAVSLPVVLLILDVYPLRRLGGASGWWTSSARRVYAEKLPFVALAGAVSALAFVALRHEGLNMASLQQVTVTDRVVISVYSLGFYLWKMLAPVSLSPLYELPPSIRPWAWPFLLSYAVVAALTVLAIALRRRVPGLGAAWLAYVVILVPVLGFFQNGPQIAADRYTYLACVGFTILAGGALLVWSRTAPLVVSGVAVCLLLGLGSLTWRQAEVWHDAGTLWAHALTVDPGSALAHNNLANHLIVEGKDAEAFEHWSEAARLKPDYSEAHLNLGHILAARGALAEATAHYAEAVRLLPRYAKAQQSLGLALARQGRLDEAITHYAEAARLKPDSALTHYQWAIALAEQKKPAEAIERYRDVLRIKPDFALAHNNLGMMLAAQGQLDEARAHYEQAVRFKPDFAEAYLNWGDALAQQGRTAEAIARYEQAVRIRPQFAAAHQSLAVALTKQGRLAEAGEHMQRAQRLTQ